MSLRLASSCPNLVSLVFCYQHHVPELITLEYVRTTNRGHSKTMVCNVSVNPLVTDAKPQTVALLSFYAAAMVGRRRTPYVTALASVVPDKFRFKASDYGQGVCSGNGLPGEFDR